MKRAKTLIVALTAGLAASLLPAGIAVAAPAAPAASAHAQADKQTRGTSQNADAQVAPLYNALGVGQNVADDSSAHETAPTGSDNTPFGGATQTKPGIEYAEGVKLTTTGTSTISNFGSGPNMTDKTIRTPDLSKAITTTAIPFKAEHQTKAGTDDVPTDLSSIDGIALLSVENGHILMRLGNPVAGSWGDPFDLGPDLAPTSLKADGTVDPATAASLVGAAGDIDGDGVDEIAVSVPFSAKGNSTVTGFDIKVFRQKNPDSSARWTSPLAWQEVPSLEIKDYENTGVASGKVPRVSLALGDLNGDGKADLADAYSYAPNSWNTSYCDNTNSADFNTFRDSRGFWFSCPLSSTASLVQSSSKATVRYVAGGKAVWTGEQNVDTGFSEPAVTIAQVGANGQNGLVTAGLQFISGRLNAVCGEGNVYGRTCDSGGDDDSWFATEEYRAPAYGTKIFTANQDGTLTKRLTQDSSGPDNLLFGPHEEIYGPGAHMARKEVPWGGNKNEWPKLPDMPSADSSIWSQLPALGTAVEAGDSSNPGTLWIGIEGAWVEADLLTGSDAKVGATSQINYQAHYEYDSSWGMEAWTGTLTQNTSTAGLQCDWSGADTTGSCTTDQQQLFSFSVPASKDSLDQANNVNSPHGVFVTASWTNLDTTERPGGANATPTGNGVPALLANEDIDAPVYVFNHYAREYSDPQFIAFLAAPPYFKELYDLYSGVRESETSAAWKSGTGTETANGYSIAAGAYTEVKEEIKLPILGITLKEWQAEASVEAESSHTFTSERTLTYSTDFDAKEDTVVLGITPANVFYYTAYGVGLDGMSIAPYTVIVRQPEDPITTSMALDKYDSVAAQYNLQSVPTGPTSGVFEHSEGDPASYGYNNMQFTWTGGDTAAAAGHKDVTTGFGENKTAQSVEIESSNSTESEIKETTTWKAGTGAGGVVVGTEGSASTFQSTTTTDLSGTEFSASVAGMPYVEGIPKEGTSQQFGFSWHMATKYVQVGTGSSATNVPYVTYVVSNVQQPVGTPRNFRAEDIQSNAITFQWDKADYTDAPAPVTYQIMKLVDGTWVPLPSASAIPASQTLFTLTDGVAPGTSNQYAIRAVGTDGDPLIRYSLRSPALTVGVPATTGVPVVHAANTVVNALIGSTASMSVTAAGVPGGGALAYQWQKWDEETATWSSITGANDTGYTVPMVTANDLTKYRCQVSQAVDGQNRVGYSNAITVELGQIATKLTLTVNSAFPGDIEPGDIVTFTAAVSPLSSQAYPTGSVTFTGGPMSATDWQVMDGGTQKVALQAGNAQLNWVVPSGVNWSNVDEMLGQMTASYAGDTNYQAAGANGVEFIVYPLGYSLYPNDQKIAFHTVTASATTGGAISPSGAIKVPDNYSKLNISETPAYGAKLAGYYIDGAGPYAPSVGQSSSGAPAYYQLTNIKADHAVNVVFSQLATIAVPTSQQIVSPGGRFQVPGAPSGLNIIYSQGGTTIAAPDAPGLYDVHVTRLQDTTYKAVSVDIPDGLRVMDKNPMDPVFTNQPPTVVTAAAGGTLTLTAPAVAADSGTFTYAWTHNGQPAGSGATLTVNPVTAATAGAWQVCVTRDAAGVTGTSCYSYTVVVAGVAGYASAVASIKLALGSKTLYVVKGKTVKVPAIVYPAAGQSGKVKVTWKSSKKKIAGLSTTKKALKKGKGSLTATTSAAKTLKFKGLKTGKATITLKALNRSFKLKVVVVSHAKAVTKAKLVTKTKRLKRGKAVFFTAKATPATATAAVIHWSVSNKKVATVDKVGRLKAKKKGKVVLTAKIGSKKVRRTITIK